MDHAATRSLVYWVYATVNQLGGQEYTIERDPLSRISVSHKHTIRVKNNEQKLFMLREKLITLLYENGYKTEVCVNTWGKKRNGQYYFIEISNIQVVDNQSIIRIDPHVYN